MTEITQEPNFAEDINIVEELEKSYLEYSLSVIIGRAIPDVRDGLKPVHRRILYAMHELGTTHNRAYKKSARIVGDVIGKYHPHGDSSVYEALVRLAQDFSMREPLVDGQGNFGSIDGDNAAAMRYTEARMSKLSSFFLADIEKQTVNFRDNYDNSLEEPVVLPSRIPNLLLNGTSGVAVGMATEIPSHNLHELIAGLICLLDNPKASINELMEHIKGPDYPTGCQVYGDFKSVYETGNGRIFIKGVVDVENYKNKERIVIKEIPFSVKKEALVEKIAKLVSDGKIEGIKDLRDESDRNGIRIAIDLKKDAYSETIISKLYKYTNLKMSKTANMVAVHQGQPQNLNLKQIMSAFLGHRKEIVTRRTKYDLNKAERRLHILEGLLIALRNIDEVVRIIKQSDNVQTAKETLIDAFDFSERQAKAILEMRLQNLTNMESSKIIEEHTSLVEKIAWYKDILNNEETLRYVIKEELSEINTTFNMPRKSEIISPDNDDEISNNDKELYPDEDVILTYSKKGYMKRVKLSEFRSQSKGGKGVKNSNSNEDAITHVATATNHKMLLAFTTLGRVYRKNVFEVPQGSRTARGVHVANIFEFQNNEQLATFLIVDPEQVENEYCLFATKNGRIMKVSLEKFTKTRATGKNAIRLNKDDYIISVINVKDQDDFMLITRNGLSSRCAVDSIRTQANVGSGVRGIKLRDEDFVIASTAIKDSSAILFTVTSKGFGKKTPIDEYKAQARGGFGKKAMVLNDKTGLVVNAHIINNGEEALLTTVKGQTIRFGTDQVRETGRVTKGVKIVTLDTDDKVLNLDLIKD